MGKKTPLILHKIYCDGRANYLDKTGGYLKNINYINEVFENLENENLNISIFDIKKYPDFVCDTPSHNIFKEDNIHFKAEVNAWVASEIFENYFANL